MTLRRALSLLFAFALAVVWPVACAGPGGDDSDSNTNWLRSCATGADCTSGLACRCGLCTRPCTSSVDCSPLGDAASCVALGTRGVVCPLPGDETASVCTRRCGEAADCGAAATCEDGACVPRDATRDASADAALPLRDAAALADRSVAPPHDATIIAREAGTPTTDDGICSPTFPPGGCRPYPDNAYGGSFWPGDCGIREWTDGCIEYYVCHHDCTKDEDCPTVPDGNPTPHCVFHEPTDADIAPAWCVLDCGAGTVCPAGMVCVPRPGDGRKGCYWMTDLECPMCPHFPSCQNG